MLRASRELLAIRSPLDAELMVSELLGTWWGERSSRHTRDVRRRRSDVEELIGEGLVAYAAQQGSPAALALLSGVACLGTPRQAARAERAALAMMERGVARPGWAEHVGAVTSGQCYVNSDAYGDRDEVVCLFTYAGEEQHALVVVVDYNTGGIARDGWVTSQVDKLLEYCRNASEDTAADAAPSGGTKAGVAATKAAVGNPAKEAARKEASPSPDAKAARPEPVKAGTLAAAPVQADSPSRSQGEHARAGRASGEQSRGDQSRGGRDQDSAGAGRTGRGPSAPRSGRPVFRPLDPPDARRMLESALAATDSLADPPVSKSFPAYHAFIRARVHTLPPAPRGSTGFRRPTWRKDSRATLVAEFLASDQAEDLSDREAASRCADHIMEYGCEQDFGRPLRISPAKAETFLLDWLPRKVMLRPAEQHAMPHVLAAWIRWAGARSGLSEQAVGRCLDSVFDSMGTFTRVYHDPASFGLEPALVARLLPDSDLEALPRRAFAFPVLRGGYRGTDLGALSPAVPADRRLLLAAYHDETGDRPADPRHIDRHLELADRLWRGDPPELWEAAQRLLDLGEDRHAVLHVLINVIRAAGDSEDDIAEALADLPPEEPG
jgi:hypothetical protein